MNLEVVQDSVIAKLQSYFVGHSSLNCKAAKLPDTDRDYERAISENIVFVSIMGGNAEQTISTGPVMQKRKLNVVVIPHASSLYADDGLQALQDVVERVLLGFKPTNCDKLIYVKDERDKIAEHGVWLQSYNFETTCMMVQDPVSNDVADELIGGNLNEINYNPSTINGS
jgi:hypothetical protein